MDNVDTRKSSSLMSSEVIWSAIIAGVILSLSSEILLNLLGTFLGLINVNSDPSRAMTVGVGSVIWLAISGIISMGIGGWFVGSLSNLNSKIKLAYNALIAWGIALLAVIILTSSMTISLISGSANLLKNITQVSAYQGNMPDLNRGSSGNFSAPRSGGESSGQDQGQDQSQGQEQRQSQDQKNDNINNVTSKIGIGSLIMFIAFTLSGIASVLGAIYSRNRTFKNEK